MQMLFDLVDHCELTVEYVPLYARDGEYRDDLRLIRLREGMSPRLERWVLAHELGHAVHRHSPNIFGETSARDEHLADEWAALVLIDLEQYRDAEALREGHVPAIAHDLGVVTRGIQAFQRALARIGDDVYLKPRHGAGQWAARLAA